MERSSLSTLSLLTQAIDGRFAAGVVASLLAGAFCLGLGRLLPGMSPTHGQSRGGERDHHTEPGSDRTSIISRLMPPRAAASGTDGFPEQVLRPHLWRHFSGV